MIKNLLLSILFLTLYSCVSGEESSLGSSTTASDITISLLQISPASAVVQPLATTSFSGIGGTPPYIFSVSAGSGTVSDSGTYTAPASTGQATVKVQDVGGSTAYAVVNIGTALSISPTSASLGTNSSVTFSGVGGLLPYTYTLVSGTGDIDASSGVYTSGVGTGTASVKVTDSNANAAIATVNVNTAVGLTPTTLTIKPNDTYSFSISGGVAPIVYSVYAGSGLIDANTGLFTAPAAEGTTIIRATDTEGTYEESTITIVNGPTISASASKVKLSDNITFSSSTGTPPFSYSVTSGSSTIVAATGVLTGAAAAEMVTVEVSDANSFTDSITVEVFRPRELALGDYYSCMITYVTGSNSQTKCWGFRETARLGESYPHVGTGPAHMGDNLEALDLDVGVNAIAIYGNAGEGIHQCILFSDNSLKCFGYNGFGQLGVGNNWNRGNISGTMGDKLAFAKLGTGVSVNSTIDLRYRVALGYYHTCVITNTDEIKCFGRGNYGQLGHGSTGNLGNTAATSGDNLVSINIGAETPVQITAGDYHTCARFSGGNVRCWGYNGQGALGYEDRTNRGGNAGTVPNLLSDIDLGTGRTAVEVIAGRRHTCAILDNNTLKCWGYNNYGQLGIGNTIQTGDGVGEMGDSLPVVSLNGTPSKLSVGYGYTCVILSDNSVKCWGFNGFGELGLGDTNHRGNNGGEMGINLPTVDLGTGRTATQLATAGNHTCALLDNGDVKCWGRGSYGALGQGNSEHLGNGAGEMGDSLTSIDLGAGLTAVYISSTGFNTCAVLSNGNVKCWGRSYQGSAGRADQSYGDSPGETLSTFSEVDLGTGIYADKIAAGLGSTCVITTTGTVKCWGYNNLGQLGIGSTSHTGDFSGEMGDSMPITDLGTGFIPVELSAYDDHFCSRNSAGIVKCWGEGGSGRLGVGSTARRGDGGGEMGDNLVSVNLGGDVAVEVEAGTNFTCVRLSDGNVKCWGEGTRGVQGKGNGNDLADGADTPDTYSVIDLGAGLTARDLGAGNEFVCAIIEDSADINDGKVKCWGRNNRGQLGQELPTNFERGDSANEMGDNIPYTDLGSGETAISLAAAHESICALLANGKIKCWGYGGYGNLGNGTGSGANIGDGADEMGDNITYVDLGTNYEAISIYSGLHHFCAVLSNNDVKCWGRNNYGHLGNGHRYDVGQDALSLGDNLPVINQ